MELSLAKPVSRKQLLLKDYLLDDLSSCSSSGFRSYPRKQCCNTVRFLLEIDLKAKPAKYKKKPFLENPLKPAPKASVSAFQRASKAVVNAVKNLPFASFKKSSPSSSKLKLGILPRSLSRKLLKRSFLKRNDHKEIQLWKPIEHDMIQEKSCPPPDFIITMGGAGDDSNSSTSDSKSNSWSDSDFTTSDDSSLQYSSDNCRSKIREEVVVGNNKKRLPKDEVVSSKSVGVTVGAADDSIDVTTSSNSSTNSTNGSNAKKQWPNEEKEQQFSPVSVLDCPFEDDDDEVSSPSPFQHRLQRTEGTNKRLMKKINKFGRLTHQLEPVNLVTRIALTESDQESNSNESPLNHLSNESIQDDFISDVEEVAEDEENQAEEKELKLLELIKSSMPSTGLKLHAEKLLFDFFKWEMKDTSENPIGLTTRVAKVTPQDELLNRAKSWLEGQPMELLLDWKVTKNREVYIRDMERGGEWKNTEKEKQEVAMEMEVEVFALLMNELLDDLLLS